MLQVEEVVRHDGEQLQEDVYKMFRLLDVALNSKVGGGVGCCRQLRSGAAQPVPLEDYTSLHPKPSLNQSQ